MPTASPEPGLYRHKDGRVADLDGVATLAGERSRFAVYRWLDSEDRGLQIMPLDDFRSAFHLVQTNREGPR